jgi:hypothetical protein
MSKIEIKLPKREYKKEEYYFVDSEEEKEEEDKFNIDKENELIAQEMFLREGINDEDDIEVGENIINVFKKYNDIYLKKNKICLKENEIEKIDRLKKELDENKIEIKKYIDNYNDNLILRETEEFDKNLKDIDIYSNKIKEIMNSKYYQGNNKDDKQNLKEEIKKNLILYNETIKKLEKNINSQKEILKFGDNNNTDNNNYYIINYVNDENIKKLNLNNELDFISKKLKILEETIGIEKKNYLINNGNISNILYSLLTKLNNNLNETKENKEKLLNEINSILDNINEKNEKLKNSNYFSICNNLRELYLLFEFYEKYDNIFEYLKKRLLAIQDIYNESDKFNDNIKLLKEKIQTNEKEINELVESYKNIFKEFEKIENIIISLNIIEKQISDKLL